MREGSESYSLQTVKTVGRKILRNLLNSVSDVIQESLGKRDSIK